MSAVFSSCGAAGALRASIPRRPATPDAAVKAAHAAMRLPHMCGSDDVCPSLPCACAVAVADAVLRSERPVEPAPVVAVEPLDAELAALASAAAALGDPCAAPYANAARVEKVLAPADLLSLMWEALPAGAFKNAISEEAWMRRALASGSDGL